MNDKSEHDTRKAIIEASMRLFARRGYHGTSVAQIAEETGLTKGALYWHFKGKEHLFLSVLDCIKDNWYKAIMGRVEASQGVIKKLEQFFDAASERVAAGEDPYSMHLFLVSAGAQPELRKFEDAIRNAYAGYVKTLIDMLRDGQKNGEIRTDIDAEATAVGIIGCLEGVVLQARLYPPVTIAAAITEMKHHFVHSLRTRPARPSRKEKRVPAGTDQLRLF